MFSNTLISDIWKDGKEVPLEIQILGAQIPEVQDVIKDVRTTAKSIVEKGQEIKDIPYKKAIEDKPSQLQELIKTCTRFARNVELSERTIERMRNIDYHIEKWIQGIKQDGYTGKMSERNENTYIKTLKGTSWTEKGIRYAAEIYNKKVDILKEIEDQDIKVLQKLLHKRAKEEVITEHPILAVILEYIICLPYVSLPEQTKVSKYVDHLFQNYKISCDAKDLVKTERFKEFRKVIELILDEEAFKWLKEHDVINCDYRDEKEKRELQKLKDKYKKEDSDTGDKHVASALEVKPPNTDKTDEANQSSSDEESPENTDSKN